MCFSVIPGLATQKELEYLRVIDDAIQMFRPIEFTYVTDDHAKWRAGFPCRVGELNNGNLGLEAYNPNWTTDSGTRRQPHKLFLLKDMDNLRLGDGMFSSFEIIGYEHVSERFARVEAEL
mgnify:FL=1